MKTWLDSLPSPSRRARRFYALVAALVLLGVFAAEVACSSREFSATWNEPYHLFAGYAYWHSGDYGVNPEHPPLAKLVGAIPLFFMPLKAPRVGRDESKPTANMQGRTLVYANNADSLLWRARLAEAVVGLLMILLLFEAGFRLFGAGAAWMAATLAVFDPNLVAHCALVTTDFACACFYFAAVYALWRVAERPNFLRLAGCGASSGLALASKHSAVLLVPTLGLLAALEIAVQVQSADSTGQTRKGVLGRELRRWAGRLAVVYAGALIILWGFYAFRFQARPDGLPLWQDLPGYAALLHSHVAGSVIVAAAKFKLLPESYLFGLIDVLLVTTSTRMSFLLGHLHPHAVWTYYPVAFVIKSTVGFLALLAAAIVTLKSWRGEGYRKAAYLLLPPAIFLGAAMNAGTNMGIRHILPMFPFLILAAAGAGWTLLQRHRAGAILVAALMALHIASSLRSAPDYLAYGNELFGGTAKTYQSLADSNVDWGQGLREAREYLAGRNVKDCWYAYIGTADTAYYHLPCKMLPNPFLREPHAAVPPETYHGVVLIGATEADGSYFGAGALNPYEAFQHARPVANIGGSVLVFEGDVDLRRAAALIHMSRAWELYDAKNQEAAIQEALKAGDLAPEHPGPPFIVGYILAQAKRTEAARAQFAESLKLAEAAHPEYQPTWERAARDQLALLPK